MAAPTGAASSKNKGFRLFFCHGGVQLNTVLRPPRQSVYEFMRQFEEKERCSASTRVIAKALGYRSQNSVIKHLRSLAREKLVRQLADKSWAVSGTAKPPVMEVPLYGTIPAGFPTSAEQDDTEKIAIDAAVHGLAPGRKYWALRVSGDSMVNAHIVDGDIAILERREPRTGEIVAALVDETTTTLKRLAEKHGRVILQAANSRYRDIEPTALTCQGVLVSLIGLGSRS